MQHVSDAVSERRKQLIRETLFNETMSEREWWRSLEHFGCTVEVLPSEAEGSIIPLELPKTAAGPEDLKNAA
jgi:hypothetical protein